MKLVSFFALILLVGTIVQAGNPRVVINTSMGQMTVELYPDKAPKTVENFMTYVKEGFYNDTIFHRVIKDFMIQCGGFDLNNNEKATHDPIVNEADNGLSNDRGTLAMARTNDPHSATSQFFINHKDNTFLDFKSKDSGRTWGYCVFGKVIDGMEVIDKIAAVKTAKHGPHGDWPVEPVIINSINLLLKKPVPKPKVMPDKPVKKPKK